MNTPAPSQLPAGWWRRVRHDLRGAVAPMRMALQLLRAGKVDAAEREEALQVMDRQVESLLAVIEDVSELIRAQAGGFAVDETGQDANLLLDILPGRGALVRGLAERKLSLRCEPCEAEALVGHDPARTAALLEFLLLRVAAYAPPGGELLLSLRQGEAISLHMSGAAAGLDQDSELVHLLGSANASGEPSLRALLMREVLRAAGIDLRLSGTGALSLHFRPQSG